MVFPKPIKKFLALIFCKKNSYLEEIGITSYARNHFGGPDNFKQIFSAIKYNKIAKKTGVDPRDCWDLETTFYLWLYEHLCQLLKDTNADLTWQKFQHNDKEYTEGEYIEYLKKLLLDMINFDEFKNVPELPPDRFEKNEDDTITSICTATEEQLEEFRKIHKKNCSKCEKLRREIFDVFYKLLPALWW